MAIHHCTKFRKNGNQRSRNEKAKQANRENGRVRKLGTVSVPRAVEQWGGTCVPSLVPIWNIWDDEEDGRTSEYVAACLFPFLPSDQYFPHDNRATSFRCIELIRSSTLVTSLDEVERVKERAFHVLIFTI